MEDTNQQSLYCVVTQRIVGDFIQYLEFKEFLIKSDHPVKIRDLTMAVREYVSTKHQLNIDLVSIYNMIDVSKPEDKKRWYEIVESGRMCYEYHNGRLYQMFL